MTDFILAIILLILALGGVVVRKTYFYIPARELKRQAANQDRNAVQLYRAVAFGNSLRGLLWLYIGLTSAGSLVLMARVLPVWAGLLIVGPLLWITFSLLPATRSTKVGTWLTMIVTPTIAWTLNYLHPLLSRGADVVERRYTAPAHTKLFELNDLLELIERQQDQSDNRLSAQELEIVKRALSFDDYKVRDVLTPRKQVKTVLADDTVGPILIDELHKSHQSFVLVREKAAKGKGVIVGTLEYNKLDLKSTGKVQDVMNHTLYYAHENDSLREAFQAFFATNSPMFVVVNSFEEYVGIITVKAMLHQLLGNVFDEDFDQYDDLGAVAARHPSGQKKLKKSADHADQDPVKTEDEVVE